MGREYNSRDTTQISCLFTENRLRQFLPGNCPLTLEHAVILREPQMQFPLEHSSSRTIFNLTLHTGFQLEPALCNGRTDLLIRSSEFILLPVNIPNDKCPCQVARAESFFEGCSSRGGTGSSPPGWKGWHLAIRLAASHEPLSGPWTSIASSA